MSDQPQAPKQDPTLHTNILGGQPAPTKDERTALESTNAFNKKRVLYLIINGTLIHLPLTDNFSLMIGRGDVALKITPDLDLTLYGGASMGVSRVHARLQFFDGKLSITDLASSNGTFLDGDKLPPNQSHTVKPGQVIHLGKLKIAVKAPE
jgi:pSer/pThr/pTyr-binding forkhead associated (FHA) protein